MGKVVHVSNGSDGVMESDTTLRAVTKDLVILHAGAGVLDARTDPAMLGAVGFFTGQEGAGAGVCGAGRRGRC